MGWKDWPRWLKFSVMTLVIILILGLSISFLSKDKLTFFKNSDSNTFNASLLNISDWNTYRNIEYGFEFKAPKDYNASINFDLLRNNGTQIDMVAFPFSKDFSGIDSYLTDCNCVLGVNTTKKYGEAIANYYEINDASTGKFEYFIIQIPLKNDKILFLMGNNFINNKPNEAILSTFKYLNSDVVVKDIETTADCELLTEEYQKQECYDYLARFKCKDSDNGVNFAVKGIVTTTDKSSGIQNNYTDSCTGVQEGINEFVCGADDCVYSIVYSTGDRNGTPLFMSAGGSETCNAPIVMSGYNYDCRYLFLDHQGLCKDGACVPSPYIVPANATCKDSDGGRNYYSKGIVTSPNYYGTSDTVTKEDSCEDNGIYLKENWCMEDGIGVTGNQVECPKGCKDGACIL